MQFKESTAVYSSDNEHVGHVDRIVLDPNTKKVTHLVVRQGFLFTEDKVIPIGLVDNTFEDRVTLQQPADTLDLPNFEETHYLTGNYYDEQNAPLQRPAGYAWPLFAYPPVGATWWGYPGYQSYPYTAANTTTEQNIPDNTVALKEGSPVISADGDRVGSVESIITDSASRRASHLVISKGLIFKSEKLIPTSWIANIVEDEVRVSMGTDALNNLPDYED